MARCFEDPSRSTGSDLYSRVISGSSDGVTASDVGAVASALKKYFRELADPLVPFDFYDAVIATARIGQVRFVLVAAGVRHADELRAGVHHRAVATAW